MCGEIETVEKEIYVLQLQLLKLNNRLKALKNE